MERHLRSFYFAIVKFVGILSLVIWGITQSPESTAVAGGEFLLGALFLLSSVMTDIDTKRRLMRKCSTSSWMWELSQTATSARITTLPGKWKSSKQ